MLPCTIHLMFSATSFLDPRRESSGPKQPGNGRVPSQRLDIGQSRSTMRPSSVTVTKPSKAVPGFAGLSARRSNQRALRPSPAHLK